MNKTKKCFWCDKIIENPTSNVQKYHKECYQEHKKEYDKNKDKNKLKERFMKFRQKNPEYFNNYHKKYQKKRGIITKVIKSTNNRFKKDKECVLCKSKINLQFHHFRYRLSVQRQDFTTFCRICHTLIHSKPIKSRLGLEEE